MMGHESPSPSATPDSVNRCLWERYFTFLDNLRKSGATNMFGAAPYLQNSFGIDRTEARKIHIAWMETFDGQTSVADRVAKAEGR